MQNGKYVLNTLSGENKSFNFENCACKAIVFLTLVELHTVGCLDVMPENLYFRVEGVLRRYARALQPRREFTYNKELEIGTQVSDFGGRL